MENKQTNGKNSFHVKDLNNLKLNEDPEKTPSLPDLYNTSTESQSLDFPDVNETEDDNINNPIERPMCNPPNQITREEENTALKTKVVALKEFILEKLYVTKKSVEDLRYQHHQHTPYELLAHAFFKEEIV